MRLEQINAAVVAHERMLVRVEADGRVLAHKRPGPWKVERAGHVSVVTNAQGVNWASVLFADAASAQRFADALNAA